MIYHNFFALRASRKVRESIRAAVNTFGFSPPYVAHGEADREAHSGLPLTRV